jgi:prepilin-type N-terminal cleavage/methylation domain-containing protein
MFRRTKEQGGFTLIELLVVISIISLLSSVVLATVNSARGKARDAKRAEQRLQVETALNFYYNDFGTWPSSGGGASLGFKCFGAPTTESCFQGTVVGYDPLVTSMRPYMSTYPTVDGNAGSVAYNRFLYSSYIAAGDLGAGTLEGAYLVWFKENTMTTTECHSKLAPQFSSPYWYCYEFVGSP